MNESLNQAVNPTLPSNAARSNLGITSVAMAISGVILPVLAGLIASLLHRDMRTGAYLVFLAFEVVALSIGVVAREQKLGRAGMIAASALLLLSVPIL